MKNMLLSTVAVSAFVLISTGAALAADQNVIGDGSTLNQVQAAQTLSTNITGSAVSETSASAPGDKDSTARTGDIGYAGTTVNAPGVFTLQNQTGLNNGGNNGGNLAVQANTSASGQNIHLEGSAQNIVNAAQTMTSQIINSPVTISNYETDENLPLNRTGDVTYSGNTFSGVGLYTLQNQTGLNDAGNNGFNLSAQANLDAPASIHLDDGAVNQVSATQTMTSVIDPSNVTITNTSLTDELGYAPNRTGDVTYSASTFNAPGVYTLQNNTGLDTAANNGAQLAVQYNNGSADSINLDDSSKNLVLASQTMGATIANSTVSIANSVDATAPSRTGDVTYTGATFNGAGLYTISNNTGMNNAANNAMNISVQLNGGI